MFQNAAAELGVTNPHWVHRDFQSQNILVRGEQVYLIDFQGMRRGHREYDLASLIYDPYMNHSPERQQRLVDLWQEVSADTLNPEKLRFCAMQRLMQSLGAYGNIFYNQGISWYGEQIAPAVSLLKKVIEDSIFEPILLPLLQRCES